MRHGTIALLTAAAGALLASVAAAFAAGEQPLSAEAAEKMAAACVAYAKAHDGAVNVWIFDASGELLNFQRMDGAPPMPPLQEFELRDGFGFDPNRGASGGISIRLRGRTVGTAKAAGMGPAGDLACAQAAAKAAE